MSTVFIPRALTRAGGLLCLLPLLAGSLQAAAPTDSIQAVLRTRLEMAHAGSAEALAVDDARMRSGALLTRFYVGRRFEPAWTDDTAPTPRADSLVAALRAAEQHGLRPSDYQVSTLDSLRAVLQAQADAGEPLDPRRLSDFELLCTDGFFLYGTHLLHGRLDSETHTPIGTADRRADDLLNQLRAVEDGTPLRTALATLAPSNPEYTALTRLRAEYQSIASEGNWPTLPDGPKLERGVQSDRVPPLRRRLQATDDLSDTAAADRTVFDSTLAVAVTRFQARHGLDTDGIVGPATRAALNVPVADRIQQLEVNLERWRWLPRDLGTPHVRVNIAGFELQVMEKDTEVLKMRVVAGTPYRQTPVFSDQISYLVFNPYWNLPTRIATQDKLPAFKSDPSRVDAQGYEVLRGWGADARPIDPSTIDWDRLSASNFPYRLRQRPGPQNALGQVKFMFPNAYSVYLHDTPARALFGRSERSFSSGCIRVERPLDLAAFLLRENEGWSPARIRSTVGGSREQTVVLNRNVPVHLLYWTAWMDGDTAQFRRDVYSRDGPVATALRRPLPSPERWAEPPTSVGE
ncbi:MAG: L,D-transpeptidase family protein [Salinibacter sp.]